MTNHNKTAADEFCNTTHTSPIDSYVVNRIRELETQVNRLKQERDEVRQSYCSLMEAYRGGDGKATADKLGWGYLFDEDKPCQ